MLCFVGHSCFAADVTGNWIAEIVASGESQYARVNLTADGGKLSGKWGENTVTGTVSQDNIELVLTDAQGKQMGSLTGRRDGEKIVGTGTLSGGRGGRGGRIGGAAPGFGGYHPGANRARNPAGDLGLKPKQLLRVPVEPPRRDRPGPLRPGPRTGSGPSAYPSP